MDWTALLISIKLGLLTVLMLIPPAILLARWLATRRFSGKSLLEATLTVPLVLPPTVIGYYLLVGLGGQSLLGQWIYAWTGQMLVFHFSGLLVASFIVNIPFAVQPMQRAFEAIPQDIRDSAACCGMSFWRSLLTVELPLAWPGVVTAMVLTFAHTLGEFGVILMIGGNLPGETTTIAISIYDQVQAFNYAAAGQMSLILLVFSISVLALTNALSGRMGRRYGLPQV